MDTIRTSNPDFWLAQVFSAKSVANGGVIRRNRTWVEAEIGIDRFVQTVRARGFHLIEAGQRLIVNCHNGPITMKF